MPISSQPEEILHFLQNYRGVSCLFSLARASATFSDVEKKKETFFWLDNSENRRNQRRVFAQKPDTNLPARQHRGFEQLETLPPPRPLLPLLNGGCEQNESINMRPAKLHILGSQPAEYQYYALTFQ